MSIEAEAAPDEAVAVSGQEVGQVERAGLVVLETGERRPAAVDLVTVGAGQPLDTFVLEHTIEQAASAAIGVGDEDAFDAARPSSPDLRPHGAGYPFRPIVQRRRQARQVHRRQPGTTSQLDELAGERAAADDERR